MSRRSLVFILGAGRSGTSALTRVLSLCGCALPDSLVGGTDWNVKGLWEPTGALEINDKFLRKYGSSYFDASLRVQHEIVVDRGVRDDYIAEIVTFLAGCPREHMLVVKDPRITALFEFWLEAAIRSGFSIKVVVAIRHPREVVASFCTFGMPEDLLSAVWLKYNLLAERQSRELPRVFVDYSNLLKDWRVEVARVSTALSIELKATDEVAVDNFLTYDLYRQRIVPVPVEVFGDCWISRVHTALRQAAQDIALDLITLDEIYQAYSESERAQRMLCSGSLNLPPIRNGKIESLVQVPRRPAAGLRMG